MELPVLIPQNRQPNMQANNPEQAGDQERERSISPSLRSVEEFEEGDVNGFHLRKEQPTSQDTERRAKEFKGRHIQMMALGITCGD